MSEPSLQSGRSQRILAFAITKPSIAFAETVRKTAYHSARRKSISISYNLKLAINFFSSSASISQLKTGHQPQSWYPLFMHLLAMDCASAMLEFVIFSTSLRFN